MTLSKRMPGTAAGLIAGAALALSVFATSANAAPALPNLPPASTLAQNVADWDGPPRADWRASRGDDYVQQTYHRGGHWRGPGVRFYGWNNYGHRRGGGWNQCRSWRHECAYRWPALGWRYRRCMANHGC